MNSKIEKLSNALKKATSRLGTKTNAAIAAVIVTALYGISTQTNNMINSSVMITNIAGNSGGTGIILSSSETHSEILTNSHVCKVVEKGGKVTGQTGSFLVATYVHSKMHDLCIITVEGNLHVSTKVANKAPTPYYEKASISGHPALMPNVITTGHFSGRKIIAVMKGIEPCTDEQEKDPSTAFICALIGGLPQIIQYDSTLVTATIMPGSSGSGVYNEKKELSGVAFAGSGELGYAWTVPYESMKNFIEIESKTLQPQRPDNSVDLTGTSSKNVDENAMMEKLKEACDSPAKSEIKDTCRVLGQDMVYFK